MPNGTPLICPFDEAIVVRVVRSDYGAYGKHIVLWDPEQLAAVWFCHDQIIEREVGDVIYKHNLIAYSNNTGRSTGPHLHFSICKTDDNGIRLNQNNGYIGMLNPASVVKWKLENPKQPTKGGSMSNEIYRICKKDLDQCLKQHKNLVNKCTSLEAEIEVLDEKIDEQKKVISSQASKIANFEKEEKVLIDKLETAGDNLINAERLKGEWHDKYKIKKGLLKSCKIDSAGWKTKYTKLKNLKEPQGRLLKKIFYFVLEYDRMVTELKKLKKKAKN